VINPIIQRELVTTLRTRRALAMLIFVAVVFSLLVWIRWPSDPRVAQSGVESLQVFKVFGYGLLVTLLLTVPAFPALSIVREKNKGTMVLVLNTMMSPAWIYCGKLIGSLGFVLLLVMMSLPAATACFAMGGISLTRDIMALYMVLLLTALQLTAVGLCISTLANSTDGALRATYGVVLGLTVLTLAPHYFLQGKPGLFPIIANWLRCVSPVPAVMELLRDAAVGAQGMTQTSVWYPHICVSLAIFVGCLVWTISRLNHRLFDKTRDQGIMSHELSTGDQWARRFTFLVDPQRRKRGIGFFVNPVMVKEFRTRRFGRMHWMMRLAALCAVGSLALTIITTLSSTDWGPETIGGIMVFLQIALIVLITPSLAAGLISTEIDTGGWQLLQMTPLRAGVILRGKLASVVWPLLLILLATLPGYAVMIGIQPELLWQIIYVMITILLTALFAMSVSAMMSSLFQRTVAATAASYLVLVAVCAGPMLIWLGRDSPFSRSTVEAALTINPMATAMAIINTPGFSGYNLIPINWWIMGISSVVMLGVMVYRIWQLSRPQ